MSRVVDSQNALSNVAAGALVFGSSAAVLVVEIVALRLLAPYLGLTLETSTTVIGLALAAIAAGSSAGGRAADSMDPRRALGPLLAISGVVIAATPFLVRVGGENIELLLPLAALTIVVPGALLSAITPMVTALMLTDLGETGTIVGRLSGIGTVGAIFGTVITGFVLISRVRVSAILLGLGVILIVGAVVVHGRLRRRRFAAISVGAAMLAGGSAAATPRGCEVETTYHCASVLADPKRSDGRVLQLDGLRHSYVALKDPTYLEFEYTRAYAATIDAMFAPGAPLRAHHLGAGGVSMPRLIEATRPGSTNVVSEIDAGVVALDRAKLGLVTGDGLDVRIEDARLGLRAVDSGNLDLVIGDAFGGLSVPWHLTTIEMLREVRRVLAPDGVYVLNVIDYGALNFARAQAKTLTEVWPQVSALRGSGGGNIVLVASTRALPEAAVTEGLTRRAVPWSVTSGPQLQTWIGDAPVLTDDFAPVDQLLTTRP